MLAKHLARSVRGVDWILWDGSNDGDETAFSSGTASYVSACALDSETVFVAYRDTADSGIGKACLLSISGKTVSCSTPVSFFGAVVAYVSVEKLASDRVFIAFEYTGNSYGYAIIAKVIDGEIYFGPLYGFETSPTSDVCSCLIGTDKVLVIAKVNASLLYGYIIVVDGVEISSISSGANISGSTAKYPSVCELDTDKAVVAYQLTSTTKGYARVLDVSGSTITVGLATEFEAGETIYTSVEKLSSSVAVVAYSDVTNSNYGTVCALSISGAAVTPASPVVFNTAISYTYDTALARIDSTTMMVRIREGSSGKGAGCVLSISGTTITAGTPAIFTAEALYSGSLLYLKQRYLCCCYASPTKGYALILDGAA